MEKKEVSLKFNQGFEGELIAPLGTARIGSKEGTLEPYDMLLGALGSCLYATFLEIAIKKRIGYEGVDIKITGEKREEVPTTLKYVHVEMVVIKPDQEKGLDQALRLATEYCSIYQTISNVAEMTYHLTFA